MKNQSEVQQREMKVKNKTRAISQKEKKTIRLFPSNVKDELQQLFYLLYIYKAH